MVWLIGIFVPNEFNNLSNAMKSYPIHRGVDNEIEFRGLRGQHFYYAAGGLIASVFVTLFSYILGLPILVALLVLAVGSGGTLAWCYTQNNRHGRWGAVKQQVQRLRPQYVCQHQSFNRLVPVRTTVARTPR